MVDSDLKKYFEDNLKKGYSIKELKEICKKNGYDKNEINAVSKNFKKKSKLTKIIVLAFIFLGIVYFGFGVYIDSQHKAVIESCYNDPLVDADSCALNRIRQTFNMDNEELCHNIQNLTKKDQCYGTIALRSKNVDTCRKINGNIMKDDCYSALSHIKKDLELCNFVKNETGKDNCYSSLAECNYIEDDFLKKECIKKNSYKISCEDINDSKYRDFCYKNDIFRVGISKYSCEDINDDMEKERCTNYKNECNEYYSSLPEDKKNRYKINNREETCANDLEHNDLDICLISGSFECYINYIKYKDDILLCDNYGSNVNDFKKQCYSHFIAWKNETSLCKEHYENIHTSETHCVDYVSAIRKEYY